MMSAHVNADVAGEKLSAEEIAMFFLTMAIAGHETTRSTAAHFVRLMAENPDQYALLRSDPERHLPNAIDETLRMAPPVMQFRPTATRDAELGGQAIRAGDKIYLAYAAANRDPALFDDPDRFDITRANARRHLSYGTGPHVCIGARLAALQLKLLVGRIARRLPDLRPVGAPRYCARSGLTPSSRCRCGSPPPDARRCRGHDRTGDDRPCEALNNDDAARCVAQSDAGKRFSAGHDLADSGAGEVMLSLGWHSGTPADSLPGKPSGAAPARDQAAVRSPLLGGVGSPMLPLRGPI